MVGNPVKLLLFIDLESGFIIAQVPTIFKLLRPFSNLVVDGVPVSIDGCCNSTWLDAGIFVRCVLL
jgi:hypothetical protein